MSRWGGRGRLLLCAAFSLSVVGCLSNPQCNNLVGILLKVGPDRNIGSLTACEWQTVFGELPNVAASLNIDLQGFTIPDLSDAQAQAIVDFLTNHHIQTLNQLIDAFYSGSITVNDFPPELISLISSLQ